MAAAADMKSGMLEASTLLAAEGEALMGESSTLLAAAVAEEPKWRRSCRLGGAALAVLGLVAATACASALTGAGRPPAHYGEQHTEAVQGEQMLAAWAAAAKPQPGCPMLGPLPEVWKPAMDAPPLQLRVLSYNLFWWNLFDKAQFVQPSFHLRTKGNTGTQLLAQAAGEEHFDVMGFQECNDEWWLLAHSGLADQYEIFRDKHCCMAYNRSSWSLLGRGVEWVALDVQYGPRPAQWMRLRHVETGRLLFFINHHGPIPINSGGKCGGAAVAQNILNLVMMKATPGDAVVLIGDFNSDASSATIRQLQKRLRPAYWGKSFGGVDYFFSNLQEGSLVSAKNWGGGGSDHDALSVVLRVGSSQAVAQEQHHQQATTPSAASSATPTTTAATATEFVPLAAVGGGSGDGAASQMRFRK